MTFKYLENKDSYTSKGKSHHFSSCNLELMTTITQETYQEGIRNPPFNVTGLTGLENNKTGHLSVLLLASTWRTSDTPSDNVLFRNLDIQQRDSCTLVILFHAGINFYCNGHMRAGTQKIYLNPPKAMEHELLNPQKHCTHFLGEFVKRMKAAWNASLLQYQRSYIDSWKVKQLTMKTNSMDKTCKAWFQVHHDLLWLELTHWGKCISHEVLLFPQNQHSSQV